MRRSTAYVLPFPAKFTAPVGTVLECRGTFGWRFHDPKTGLDVTMSDQQGNSYARFTGGMEGSLWTVVSVVPIEGNRWGAKLVTLEPAPDAASTEHA